MDQMEAQVNYLVVLPLRCVKMLTIKAISCHQPNSFTCKMYSSTIQPITIITTTDQFRLFSFDVNYCFISTRTFYFVYVSLIIVLCSLC